MPTGELAAVEARVPTGIPARAPVLLVPGYTGSKEDFLPLLPRLAAAGHWAVAFDQRGQYESGGWPVSAAYSVDALAGDVLAVVDALGGQPVHLLGHSFGGLVARAAVITAPRRFASLTLLCSGPAAISGARARRIEMMEPLLREGGVPALRPHLEVEWRAARLAGASAAQVDFLRTRFLRSSAAGLAGMGSALRTEPDRVAELVAAGVALLVAYGVDDDAWPPAVQAAMAARLGARAVEIAGAAHSPAVEAPAATVAALLAFWAGVEDRVPTGGSSATMPP